MKKLIPYLFLISGLISCSNPVQKDYSNHTVAPKTIYQANENEQISELSVSPRKGKLALVVETKVLKIESGEMSQSYELPNSSTERIFVSSHGEAVAYLTQEALYLQNLRSGKSYKVDLDQNELLDLKWQNDSPALLLLLRADQQNVVSQYFFDNEKLESRILSTSKKGEWKCIDFNSKFSILTYIAKLEHSQETFIYWQKMDQQKVDSFKTNQNATNLSIDETGQKLAWSSGNTLYILNLKTNQVQQINLGEEIILPPVWHDQKLLCSTENGFFVLDSRQINKTQSIYLKPNQPNENVQMVWSQEQGKPVFVRQVTNNKLLIYDSEQSTIDLKLEFEDETISNLSWDESGQKLLYLRNNQVQIFDMEQHQSEALNLPFEYKPLVRWGPDEDWLAFVSEDQKVQKQYLFEYKTRQLKEFEIQLYSNIKDFSWTGKTQKVIYSIPQIARLFTYQYTGAELKYEKAYTLVADAVRWAPSNTDISQKIGEYAIFKAQPTLGIYFLKSNNLNWILHLESKKIVDFDWNPDGKQIYYVLKEENEAPVVILEQILYLDEI